VAGEVCIGGAGVGRGYVNRGELTGERFVPDPYQGEPNKEEGTEKGLRMYRTGDLGKWRKDGTIEFLGRNDLQVKVRRSRIELGEIEARLGEYDGIKEAVVVARKEAGGEKRLVAYYTAKEKAGRSAEEKAEIGAEELRSYLSDRLPEYMVPAAYVRMEKLPLTVNGKLDRKALPSPDGDAFAAKAYEAPQGELETELAAIFEDVLKLKKVGRQDNFFSLGGHSLLATRVISHLRSNLGVDLGIRTMFEVSTVASLAPIIEKLILKEIQQMPEAEILRITNA
jgi:hypothetical protein